MDTVYPRDLFFPVIYTLFSFGIGTATWGLTVGIICAFAAIIGCIGGHIFSRYFLKAIFKK